MPAERVGKSGPITKREAEGREESRFAAVVGMLGIEKVVPDLCVSHECCGFITWILAKQPHVLDAALAHRPVATMLAFGDPAPFAPAIHAAGSLLICMVQNMRHARVALDVGADIVVAQGTEAGGHGSLRSTMTLVPEVADLLARERPDAQLVAAGGIADGRGLVAALMLGADGVLMGSSFWTSEECLAHPNLRDAALARDGDATVRGITVDIAYGMDFPPEFTGRVLRNAMVDRWYGREEELRREAPALRPEFMAAIANGDADEAGINIGEVIGLMHKVRPAAEIVSDTMTEAERLLQSRAPAFLA